MTTFASLVAVLLLCVASCNAVKVVDVETICKKATNHSFCSTLLNSKSGARDLLSLVEYTINVARENMTNTINLIKKLVAQSAGNETEQYYYDTCLYHFSDEIGVIGAIDDTQKALKERNYNDAYYKALGILGAVDDCLTGDTPTIPPIHDTSLLPKYADVVIQDGQIIASIISFLMQA